MGRGDTLALYSWNAEEKDETSISESEYEW